MMLDKPWLVERNCPICDTQRGRHECEVVANSPAEHLSQDQLRAAFVGLRNDQVFFSYQRCSNCGLLFCPTYFASSFLDELYSSMPANTEIHGEESSSATQSGYVKSIDVREWKKGETVLELGSDIGDLIGEIRRIRPDLRLIAVEPNVDVHKALQEKIGTHSSLFRHHNQIPRYEEIDHLIMIHVLDHLVEPRATLVDLQRRMPQGASVNIVVHNEKSVLRRLMGTKWPPFCLQHPQIFNSQSIGQLLALVKLELVRISRTTNQIELQNLVKNGLQVLNINSRFSIIIPRLRIPIRLGNIMVTGIQQEEIV